MQESYKLITLLWFKSLFHWTADQELYVFCVSVSEHPTLSNVPILPHKLCLPLFNSFSSVTLSIGLVSTGFQIPVYS